MKKVQAIIIGGGSAGLSAAVTLKKNGIEDILVIEKDEEPGGILEQCIHNGFGLHTFKEQLSGPAYAERFIRMAEECGVKILLNTMVTKLTPERVVEYVNAEEGTARAAASISPEPVPPVSTPQVRRSAISISTAIWSASAYSFSARAISA